MNKITKKTLLVCLSVLCAGFSAFVFADIPRLISYQGKLTNAGGATLDGTYSFQFRFYNGANTLRWSETQPSVQVSGGLYSVILGTRTAGISSVSFTEPLWLEIEVAGETLSPRQLITASPYALNPSTATGETTVDYYCRQSTGVLKGLIDSYKVSPSTGINNGIIANGVKITTGNVTAGGTAMSTTFLCGNGTWAVPTGSGDMVKAVDGIAIGQSTATLKGLIDAYKVSPSTGINNGIIANGVKITTGNVTAGGTAMSTTFLCGNGTWAVPTGSGDMVKAVDGLAIGQSTATLKGLIDAYKVSPSTGINNGALADGVKVSTGNVTATGTPSNGTFLRGDGVWAYPVALVGTSLPTSSLPAGSLYYDTVLETLYIAHEDVKSVNSWHKIAMTPN